MLKTPNTLLKNKRKRQTTRKTLERSTILYIIGSKQAKPKENLNKCYEKSFEHRKNAPKKTAENGKQHDNKNSTIM